MKPDIRQKIRERLIPAFIQWHLLKGETAERASTKAIDAVMRMGDKRLRSTFDKAVDSGIVAPLKFRDDIWNYL